MASVPAHSLIRTASADTDFYSRVEGRGHRLGYGIDARAADRGDPLLVDDRLEVRLIIGGFEDDAHPRGAVRVGAGDDDGGWVDARLLGDSLADVVGLSSCDPEEVRHNEDEALPRFLEAEDRSDERVVRTGVLPLEVGIAAEFDAERRRDIRDRDPRFP